MKIAIDCRFLESEGGGVNRYISQILTRKTADDEIICISTKQIKRLPDGIRNVVLPLKFHWIIWEQIQLPLLLKKLRPDLYHAAGNWGIPLLCPVPSIVTIHDLIPLKLPNYFKKSLFPKIAKRLYFLRVKVALSTSEKIICTSAALLQDLRSHFKIEKEKVIIIPMGIDDRFFNDKKYVTKMKSRLVLPKEYVLCHGGIADRKNIDSLIKAYSYLLHKKPQILEDIYLVITGENQQLFPLLFSVVEKENLLERVIFTGWVNDTELIFLVKNAGLIAYLSFMEGFGMPLLEGMAAKIPVVASDIPAFRKYGEDVAIYANPSNIIDIAGGLYRGLHNRTSLSKLNKGRSIAKNYTWDKTLQQTFLVYNRILFRRE